jgi:hypothetical protein
MHGYSRKRAGLKSHGIGVALGARARLAPMAADTGKRV